MSKKYSYSIFSIPEIEDILDQMNEANVEIVSCFYTTDTNQVCIIYKENFNPILNILKKESVEREE